jgi:hypothetical protein
MAGFLDRAKGLAKELGGKAKTTVVDNADKIDDSIDKAAGFVDDKTKRKYSDKIGKAQGAAHKAVDKISGEEGDRGGSSGGGTA